MSRRFIRRSLLVLAAVVCCLAVALLAGERYLCYADRPFRADAVVLFVGPGFEARLGEARRLVKEGYARTLLIPAYGSTFRCQDDGRIVCVGDCFVEGFSPALQANKHDLPCYVEETQLEALEAKRLMSAMGIRSALFVSSPYHMRRIKLIADHVFASRGFGISFIPARTWGGGAFAVSSLRWTASELLKIGWFLIYRQWADLR